MQAHFYPERETVVETEASNFALGCVLSQFLDLRLHPVAFHSRELSSAERNYIGGGTPFSGRTEPASRQIASALCVRSCRISRAFSGFHFLRLLHPDAPLSLPSVRRTCCRPTLSSSLPLVSAPLSSRLLAYCLLLAFARVQRPSLLPSHLWRPRSVLFHPLPSGAILRRFLLSLHPTVPSIIPLLFTRRPARPPCRPPTLVCFPSNRRA